MVSTRRPWRPALAWTTLLAIVLFALPARARDLVTEDRDPPVISVPEDLTLEATGPAGAVATFEATAVDDVDGDVRVDCDPASGETFPIGVTRVTCTARDAAGNVAVAVFAVLVTDSTPPVLFGCPVADLVLEAVARDGAPAEYPEIRAQDLVDGFLKVDLVPPPGAMLPIGEHHARALAVDAAGNAETCDFQVVVVDTTPPELKCPSDLSVPATSAAGAVVTYPVRAFDLADPAPSLDCVPPSGDLFPIGATVVTCTARDDAGNEVSCSFRVVVEVGREASTSTAQKLDDIAPTGDARTDAEIDRAVDSLVSSSDTRLWQDETHLTKSGSEVYRDHEAAVRTLLKVEEPEPAVREAIDAIVELDRRLAYTAIAECPDGRKRIRAQAYYEQGMSRIATDPVKAAQDFGAAWRTATS